MGAVLVNLIAGCASPDDEPTRTAESSSSARAFESDEEALAAATEAFADYQDTSDAILADSGDRPERLLRVATKDVYEIQLEGYEQIAADGFHSVGHSKFDTVSLQSANLFGGVGAVVIYLCADISGTDIRDQKNRSVVRAGRLERWPLQLTFDYVDSRLLLSDQSDWSGDDFC